MLYTKIRMDFKYAEKGRFYRVLLIKGNPDLLKLGVALGDAVSVAFEHCFLITCNKRATCYVMAPFMEEPLPGYCLLSSHSLDELPEEFDFEYDTGDGWDFHCKRYKKQVEMDSAQDLILLEGAGLGVWEDNIRTLYAYLSGELPGDAEEDFDKGYAKPWNMEINHFSDFDLPLDIKKLNKRLSKAYPKDCKTIEKGERDYIKESGLDVSEYLGDDEEDEPMDIFPKEVYDAVDDLITWDQPIGEAYDKLEDAYGGEIARNLVASTYFRDCYIAALMKIEMDFDLLAEELESLVELLMKSKKKKASKPKQQA